MKELNPGRVFAYALLTLLRWLFGLAASPWTLRLMRREWCEHVARAVNLYDLRLERPKLLTPGRAVGEVAGDTVLISQEREQFQKAVQKREFEAVETYTRVVVRPSSPYPYGISMRAGRLLSRLAAEVGLGQKDIITGDGRFDEYIYLRGRSEAGVVGLMDHETREAVLALYALPFKRFQIDEDGIDVSVRDNHTDRDQVRRVIELALHTNARLKRRGGSVALLAQSVLNDLKPTVRLRCLELLAPFAPGHEEAVRVLEEAAGDAFDQIRLAAARALGPRGVPVLRRMAQAGRAPWADQAWQTLAELADPELAPLFREAAGSLETLAVAAEGLGRLRDRESVPVLLKAYHRVRAPELRLTLVKALGRIGDARAEGLLIDLVACDDEHLVRAAVDALAGCGTRSAVMPLLELERGGAAGELKGAARRAIVQIQGRLGEVDRGWLSVAEGQGLEGALSVAGSSPAGALSLPEVLPEGSLEVVPETKTGRKG